MNVGSRPKQRKFKKTLWQDVILVDPNGFRTERAGLSLNETERPIDDYAITADKWQALQREVSGKQTGNAVHSAAATVKAVESSDPTYRWFHGNVAFGGGLKTLEKLREEFADWVVVSRGGDVLEEEKAVSA